MSEPGGVAGDQLRAFVERIEHIEEEIKGLTDVGPYLRASPSETEGRSPR
jgi:hypothetical protein